MHRRRNATGWPESVPPIASKPATGGSARSLRVRLSLLLSAFVLLTAAIMIAALLANARDSVGEEMEGALRIAGALSGAPARVLALPAADLEALRHLRVAGVPHPDAPELPRQAPEWFAAWLQPGTPLPAPLPIDTGAGPRWLVPVLADEIDEAWGEVVLVTAWGFGGLVLLNLGLWFLVGVELRPLTRLRGALDEVERGDYSQRLPGFPVREIAPLSDSFNRMVEQLDEARRQVRALHARMIDLQEQERRELARELHDAFGQLLTAIRVQLAAASQAPDLPAHLRTKLRAAQDETGELLRLLRGMLDQLRPEALDVLGVEAALRDYLDVLQQRHPDLRIEADIEPVAPVSEQISLCLYRIVQEATTNVLRHAAARNVLVRLARRDGALRLEVADDGRGTAATTFSKGFGLLGMRERIEAIGGSFCAGPADQGVGFVVGARFPEQAP